MDFFQLIEHRHSQRNFLAQEIEKEKISAICAAINRAPSAGNLQAYAITIVQNYEIKKALAMAAYGEQLYLANAPILFVFATEPNLSSERYGDRGANLYTTQDCTIAASYAMLAATALGLASVWVGGFNENKVNEILNLTKDKNAIAILAVGYADPKIPIFITPRKEIESWVTYA